MTKPNSDIEKKRALARAMLLGKKPPEETAEIQPQQAAPKAETEHPQGNQAQANNQIADPNLADFEARLRQGGVSPHISETAPVKNFPQPEKLKVPRKGERAKESPVTPQTEKTAELEKAPVITPPADNFYTPSVPKEKSRSKRLLRREGEPDHYREPLAPVPLPDTARPEISHISLSLPRDNLDSISATVEKIQQEHTAKVVTAGALPTNQELAEGKRYKSVIALVVLILSTISLVAVIALNLRGSSSPNTPPGNIAQDPRATITIQDLPQALRAANTNEPTIIHFTNPENINQNQIATAREVLSALGLGFSESLLEVTWGQAVFILDGENFALTFLISDYGRAYQRLIEWEDSANVSALTSEQIFGGASDHLYTNRDYRIWRDPTNSEINLAYTIFNNAVTIGSNPQFIHAHQNELSRRAGQF